MKTLFVQRLGLVLCGKGKLMDEGGGTKISGSRKWYSLVWYFFFCVAIVKTVKGTPEKWTVPCQFCHLLFGVPTRAKPCRERPTAVHVLFDRTVTALCSHYSKSACLLCVINSHKSTRKKKKVPDVLNCFLFRCHGFLRYTVSCSYDVTLLI